MAFSGHRAKLTTHRKELTLRLFRQFYQNQHQLRLSNIRLELPVCLSFHSFDNHLYSRLDTGPDLSDEDSFKSLAWQFADLTLSIFRLLDQEFHPNSLVHTSFAQETGLPFYIEIAGFVAFQALVPPISFVNRLPSCSLSRATVDRFHSIFSYIGKSLDTEMSNWPDGQGQPSPLFYLAACYARELAGAANLKDESFCLLRDTILEHRKRTIDLGKVNSVLERRLLADRQLDINWHKYKHTYPDIQVFSPDWWRSFEVVYHPLGTDHDQPFLSSSTSGGFLEEPFH